MEVAPKQDRFAAAQVEVKGESQRSISPELHRLPDGGKRQFYVFLTGTDQVLPRKSGGLPWSIR